MVKQYSDTATIPAKATEATKSHGIITPGTQGSDIVQIGRYEPATLNRELMLVDGVKSKVKGIFYCPLSTPEITKDSLISITNKLGENILLNEKVLFFDRGQLACMLYI